jgi:uncharacterized protein YdhG (YjbR/CyaY superfamily)
MPMKKYTTVDEYLADVPAKERAVLKKIRATVKSVVPEAGEKISYGMPAFTYHGNLLYYGAMKNHLSLFPGSKSVVKKYEAEIKRYGTTSAGTIRFQVDKPLPATLIKKIVQTRIGENRARESPKRSSS